jgi:hypothetical protein
MFNFGSLQNFDFQPSFLDLGEFSLNIFGLRGFSFDFRFDFSDFDFRFLIQFWIAAELEF